VEGKDDGWLDGARRVSLATWFDGLKAGLSTENLGEWLGLVGKWGETVALWNPSHLNRRSAFHWRPVFRWICRWRRGCVGWSR
jgi:hypothetical protein